MSLSIRLRLFIVSAAGLAVLMLWGALGLPPYDANTSAYGQLMNSVAVGERHVTDVVAAVTFDYRGFDTVQEEFILFAAVAAVTLLLRAERDEHWTAPGNEAFGSWASEPSEAVRLLGIFLVPITLVVGLYIVTHGQLTPGGGFQGGAILASAPLLIYLVGEYETLRALSPVHLLEFGDALGAGGFVLVGLAGIVAGANYLANVVPLGPVGHIYSGGTIPIIEVAVGLEVASGFLMILAEFFIQTLELIQ